MLTSVGTSGIVSRLVHATCAKMEIELSVPNRLQIRTQVPPKCPYDAPKVVGNHRTIAAERFAWYLSGFTSGINPADLSRARRIIVAAFPEIGELTQSYMIANYVQLLERLNVVVDVECEQKYAEAA